MNNLSIFNAFATVLNDANLGYPIAWPNVEFKDVDETYLEVVHFSNQGIDETLSSQSVVPHGFFQVSVIGRQNEGLQGLMSAAEEVAAVFPKLTQIGPVRVSRVPYTTTRIDIEGGRTQLPLTIYYSG